MGSNNRFFIYPASFFANCGITMLNFTIIFFMRRNYGTSPALIGWLSAFWAVAYLTGCLGLRKISNMMGYRKALIISPFLMGISVLIVLMVPSEIAAFVAYMFFGFVTSIFWPPIMGWLSREVEGKELNKAVGGFNLSWSTGAGLGPWIAGLLIEHSLKLSLLMTVFLYMGITVMFLLVFGRELLTHQSPDGDGGHAGAADNSGVRGADIGAPAAEFVREDYIDQPSSKDNSSPLRFSAWIGVGSAYLLLGALQFIYPMYAEDVLMISESFTGLLLLIRSMVTVAGFYLLGRNTRWHHKRVPIIAAQILLLFCSLIFAFSADLSSQIIIFVIYGAVFSFQYTASIFHGVSGSKNRENRMAIHESSLTVGIVFGSSLGGILYQNLSFSIVMILLTFIVAFAAAAQIMTQKKTFRS